MDKRRSKAQAVPGGGEKPERSEGFSPEPGTASRDPARGRTRRRFSAEERAALLVAWEASGKSAQKFGAEHGITRDSLYRWRRGAKLASPRRSPRRPSPRRYSPEEKRAAVEAFHGFGVTQSAFARLWGMTVRSLRAWLTRYKDGGPKALEPRRRGRPKGQGPRLPHPTVRAAIVDTKRRFPWFGLRKVRDFLRRFEGLGVTVREVQRTLKEEDASLVAPPHRRRPKPRALRRFERAQPNELWQSDITAFTLARHRQPVYLVVFLDDHSRFIVSWALALSQKTEFVMEALRQGIAKYGHPKEVLTDQGRQD